MIARIRHHSRGYISLLERNEAYEALKQSQEHLAHELAAGARFVHTLLPEPTTGPIRVDWRYIPCANLGGDTFGYSWLDEEHFAVYLLDVSGHGLDSALFSVSILNVLRSQSLKADFREPGDLLTALNEAFPMDRFGDKFFTMWYGVLNRTRWELAWCNGGHPPALLFPGPPDAQSRPRLLDGEDPILGAIPGVSFHTLRATIAPHSRLFLYSDGVHEIHKSDGSEWDFEEFVAFMSQSPDPAVSISDRLLSHVRRLKGSDLLDDDFSMLELTF